MRPSPRSASLLTALVLALAGCGGGTGGDPAAEAQQRPRQFAASQQSAAPVIFSAPLADYTISKTADGYLVTDNSGREPPRKVAATARLRFWDTSLFFDADGLPGQAYRLYRAAFARTPDSPGLGYWLGLLDQGVSMAQVSQAFVDSDEYKNLYAGTTSNSAIVRQYYLNVLNRPGDDSGINYWVGILDNKLASVSGVLAGFSDSQENINGTTAAIQNGIRYLEPGVSYNGSAPSFPLRAAYHQRAFAGGTDYLSISGSCSGYASFANAVPVSASFEGATTLAAQTTFSLGLTTCSPTSLGWTATDYFDSADALLGHAEPGTEYGVASGSQRSLPVSAKVGDNGVYATQARYADSSKQSAIGQRVLSYAVEADGNSSTTAILKLSAVHTNTAGQATLTRATTYRVGSNGTLDQLAVDEVYGSGIHLVYAQSPASAQPTKLTAIDTVAGSGAVAQSGQTLTVYYTGWLYDPAAPGFKGQQFDSTAGRGPYTFPLGVSQVIQGWDQGILGMKVGGKRTLLIPSTLGYGTSGSAGAIPGNAALVFDVELVSVK
jgi:FKBP-type peptidyl-prolyl cis-trans isomerase FkpA